MNATRIETLARLVGGEFTAEDLSSWPELYQAATELAGRPVAYDQGAAMLRQWAHKAKSAATSPATGVINLLAATAPMAAIAGTHQIPNGRYTVVLTDDSDYVTLEISPWKSKPGTQIASYLRGPDNTSDFEGFGQIAGGAFSVWRRCATGYTRQQDAVRILLGADTLDTYTTAYAMKSGRCSRCGRELTVPASIHQGKGPECAKK